MKITFLGAAGTTTGSMHLLEIRGKRILLDCGLFQGKRKEAFERNRNLGLDPATLDAVLLSHAHIDHSGNLPSLLRGGFTGRILATPATRDLCDVMLRDSAFLQQRDVEIVNKRRKREKKKPFEPLYLPEDVDVTMQHFLGVPYAKPTEVVPGVTATFFDAGHIFGSASVAVDVDNHPTGRRLLFTGDLGRRDTPILRDPTMVEDVDWLITESTYGNRIHPPKPDVQGRLKSFIDDIRRQRARLIIPAFSVGRTQLLLHHLREIYESGRIPAVPVYVDSPLSSKVTKVFAEHPECYDSETARIATEGSEPFQFRGLHFTEGTEESKRLNKQKGPVVIISASGMCEGGRILHHLRHSVEDPRNIILIVGYQAQHTLGRRIVEHADPIKIYGEKYRVRARVHTINALSAHGDRDDLVDFYRGVGKKVQRVFCVHGDPEQTHPLAEALRAEGAKDVIEPTRGQVVEI